MPALIFAGLFVLIMGGAVIAFETLPTPDFMLSVQQFTFPPSVTYFLDIAQLDYGLAITGSAYTARFILRRIPGIG